MRVAEPPCAMSQLVTPVFRPLLPAAETLLPYLREIDENRWYTNLGPLVRRFEARLADMFACPVVTAANGTLAITQALRTLDIDRAKVCALPAWTFVGSVAAVQAAGLTPLFVDIDPASWTFHPSDLRAQIDLGEVGAVLPVSPFGAPIDAEAWAEFMAQTGIAVVIDAAAAFDAVSQCEAPPRCPTVVSLHATKTFGIGEGAVVLCPDERFAAKVRSLGNFGFEHAREAMTAGVNTKISEYTAAVGLAALDGWTACKEGWADVTMRFSALAEMNERLALMPSYGDGWVASYGNVILPETVDIDAVIAALAVRGIETRRWWGAGCHRQHAYTSVRRVPLPHTDALAARVLGLPFWLGLPEPAMEDVFAKLEAVLDGSSVDPSGVRSDEDLACTPPPRSC